ncbi:MAG: HAMP domain-containing protein [Candidatus Diapherotrites archaeon]|nr:HAMP domain-containing protein [Candidatus Diapherotrites archaeon]
MLKVKLSAKLFVLFLLVSIVPLSVVMLFVFDYGERVEKTALERRQKMMDTALNATQKALAQVGEKEIMRIAAYAASGITTYLRYTPDATMEELQASEEFQGIAVHPVGETGYTAVHDRNAINYFHVNPGIIGTDLHALEEKLPGFWAVLSANLNGTESAGYYEWEDADGVIRDKYMCCVAVDERDLRVCATTYMDEFTKPQEELGLVFAEETRKRTAEYAEEKRLLEGTILLFFFVSAAFIVLASFLIARVVTSPLKKLMAGMKKFSRGERNKRVKLDTRDEIGEMAGVFNEMAGEIQSYTKRLESTVKERTKELAKKTVEQEKALESLKKTAKFLIGREERIIGLKKKVKELEKQVEELKQER